MAVENKYTDANVVAGKKASALVCGPGVQTVTMVGVVAVAAADDNNSVYRVFADVPSSYIPVNICIHNTAIGSGSDYDLGLYGVDLGAAISSECLASTIDMSSAVAITTWNNLGMKNLALGELKTLGTLSGQTDISAAYDIALTAVAVGTEADTIRVTATFAVL